MVLSRVGLDWRMAVQRRDQKTQRQSALCATYQGRVRQSGSADRKNVQVWSPKLSGRDIQQMNLRASETLLDTREQ